MMLRTTPWTGAVGMVEGDMQLYWVNFVTVSSLELILS